MNAQANGKPFFRADHVGSLLRPENLLAARQRWQKGEMSPAALREVEDEAIRDVVKLQEDIGLGAVTDGEFRRENWWIDFIRQIKGVEISDPDTHAGFKKDGGQTGYMPKNVLTVAKVAHPGNIQADDFAFLRDATSHTAKVTIPSPSRIHFHGGRAAVDASVYPDMEEFWADVIEVYRREIAALEDLGCRYIQIDDPVLTYFLDDKMRQNVHDIGEDPDALIHVYAKVINACIEQRRSDTYLTIHLCRGNARSAWVSEGGYDWFADALFPAVHVDAWFLEYDDERSGGFEPLRFMPDDKKVVLGLVTSKFGALEDANEIKGRIDEASKQMPLDRLALSPQCGFASLDIGNLVSVDEEVRKLSHVIEIARDVWGEA